MNASSCYALNPGYRVRPERFGCLIYNHARGTLLAIQSPLVARLLQTDGTRTVEEMMAALTGARPVPPPLLQRAVAVLEDLARRGVIHEV